MMLQRMEQEITLKLTWKKMKFLKKSMLLSTMRRTKEVVQTCTMSAIITVDKVKSWYYWMEMIH